MDNFTLNYLNFINIKPIKPLSLAYAGQLQKHHIETIGWDTIDLFLGKKIEIEPELILKKFIEQNRGGLCYELNAAFCNLLNKLGFEAYLVSAFLHAYNDELFNFEIDTHVVIILKFLEKSFLVDVGCGDFFRNPVPLQDGIEFSDISGKYRIGIDHSYELSKFCNGQWRKQYSFILAPTQLHRFDQKFREYLPAPSHSVYRGLSCMKPNSHGFIGLKNNELIIKTGDYLEKKPIDSFGGISTILIEKFNMDQGFVISHFKQLEKNYLLAIT